MQRRNKYSPTLFFFLFLSSFFSVLCSLLILSFLSFFIFSLLFFNTLLSSLPLLSSVLSSSLSNYSIGLSLFSLQLFLFFVFVTWLFCTSPLLDLPSYSPPSFSFSLIIHISGYFSISLSSPRITFRTVIRFVSTSSAINLTFAPSGSILGTCWRQNAYILGGIWTF